MLLEVACSSNEDSGRSNKLFRDSESECVFEALFEVSSLKSGTHTLEKCFPGKRILKGWFDIPKSSFGMGTVGQPLVASIKGVVPVYAPQTKILEGGTKDEMRIFDGVFNDS
jgi:hypothetical protein